MKIKIGDNSLNLKAGGSLANIDRGPRGYSAYEIAVQNGFEGSESEWLASLVGAKGDTGEPGKDGERGIQGPRGQQGIQGEKGDSGTDGYTPEKGVDYFTEEDIESLNIPDSTSDLVNDSDFVTSAVNDLTYYTLKGYTGSLIDLEVNSSTYVVTLKLKDIDGNVISTDTIDLPLESVVVSGSFDSVNKKIILTLQNGSTVDIPVGDLVAGLQSEITSNNKLDSDLVDDTNSGNKFTNTSEKSAWNAKYTKPSGGIPKTDLASAVQTSLGKADTALQEHQDLTDYVKNTDYASSNTGGIIKNGYNTGTDSNGYLYTQNRTYSQYQTDSAYGFISKGTLENVITGKNLETANNKVTNLSSSNTDTQYPSAKCMYESQAEQDTNIDWLQTLANQMPTVSGQGTDLSLQDVLNYRLMKFLPQGSSSQFSTTGKQLFDKNNYNVLDNANVSSSSVINIENNFALIYINLPAGTYTISNNIGSYQWLISDCEDIPTIGASTNPRQVTTGTSATYTMNSSDYLLIRVAKNTISIADFVNNLQIEEGSTATPYEPYTNKIPAPNPDYPFPIKVVTGENSLVVKNKNLFDGARENIYFNNSNQFFERTDALTTNFISAKEGDKFTISTEIASNGIVIASFDENYNCLLRSAIGTSSLTLTHTCPAGTKFIIGSNYIGMTTNTQLEKGLSATPFVPHKEQNYSISLGNIELCLSPDGTVRDYIYGTPNNWFKREYVGKKVLNGSDDWHIGANGTNSYSYSLNNLKLSSLSTSNPIYVMTNLFKGVSFDDSASAGNNIAYADTSTYNGLYIRNTSYTSVSDFKTMLNTKNMVVYYELATPVDVPITDTTLISQLNNIYNKAYSYNGTTNITTTYADGNEQMYLDIEALKNVWSDLTTRVETLESEV